MHRKTILITFLSILSIPVVSTIMALDSAGRLEMTGAIVYGSQVQVSVNPSRVVGLNQLSLGFQVDFPWEWQALRDRPAERQLVKDANFKLVRIADRHLGSLDYSKGLGPCKYWNETTRTGIFDWKEVDSVVKAIYDVGAEPLIVLSAWLVRTGEKPTIPPGMAVDPNTRLPYPESYGAFAAVWVQHFKDVGLPVRYYEIFNEIQHYIGWSWDARNETRTGYFMDLFNAAYTKMHEKDSRVVVSFDASTLKWVFDGLLSDAVGIDSFNFHKYDDNKHAPDAKSDEEMFQKAETTYFEGDSRDTYTIEYCRETWFKHRGALLPTIQSEGNFNAAPNPTDERVQQMAGAVRTALLIRAGTINGLTYNVYYTLNSDATWERDWWGGGNGYGMIDCDSRHKTTQSYDKPWYPYYVQQMIGSNIRANHQLIETNCSSEGLRTLGWRDGSKLNILLICKVKNPLTIRLSGVAGQLHFFKIDDTISYTSPRLQEGTVEAQETLALNGYTVMLLQTV